MDKDIIATKNRHYYVIDMIKPCLTFGVILCHFWTDELPIEEWHIVALLRAVAVPCFMFYSFFLSAEIFMARDMAHLKSRLRRLLTPFLVWGGYCVGLSFGHKFFPIWKCT